MVDSKQFSLGFAREVAREVQREVQREVLFIPLGGE